MARITFNQAYGRMLALVTTCVLAFGFTTLFGLDSFTIYLNDKLILKQTVNQALSLRVLELGKAGENDKLHIRYNHCTIKGGAGTARNIVLKDKKGKVVKKWAFADATGQDLNMTIPVKELLAIEKTYAGQELSLHYTSRELPKGEMLSHLQH